jgi:hypothetical protein
MIEKSLKQRLADFLERHYPNWIASGEIQRLVMTKTSYTGRTVARRLSELGQAGILDRDYRRKNHVWYRFHKNETSPGEKPLFNTRNVNE